MVLVNREKLNSLVKKLDTQELGIDAFMIYKEGNIIAKGFREPFREKDPHQLFSVTKSFTSVAIGILLRDGLLDLQDRVYLMFPEYLPYEPSENMKKITVYDLLTMTAGFDEAPDDMKRHIRGEFINDFPYSFRKRYRTDSISWVRDFLHQYVENEPGERFLYSDSCSLMLAAIVQKKTGKTLKAFLRERVLSKIGIGELHWQMSPDGINTGGWGIKLRMEDLLKFALFLLKKGKAGDEQILDPSYIEDMGRAHVATGASSRSAERHFGYQTWILGDGGVFAGIGAFGQMYMIFPEEDMVYLQFGSSIRYMKALGDLVEELPEIFSDGELFNSTEVFDLKPHLEARDGDRNDILGLLGKRYIFSDNIYDIEGMSFEDSREGILLGLKVKGVSSGILIGEGEYRYSLLDVREDESTDIHNQLLYRKVAARLLKKENSPVLLLDFYETGYRMEVRLTELRHGIRCDMKRNLGFIPDADTYIIGVRDE